MLDEATGPGWYRVVKEGEAVTLLFSCLCKDTCEKIIGVLHEAGDGVTIDFKNSGNIGGVGYIRLKRSGK